MELTILTSSDLHSSFYPRYNSDNYSGPHLCGGLGKRITRLKELKQQHGNSSSSPDQNLLLFDCGDSFAGTIFFETYLGEIEMKLFELMNYDAIAIGNHDGEKGLENLMIQTQKISSSQVSILCSNLIEKKTSKLLFQNYLIRELNPIVNGKVSSDGEMVHQKKYKIGIFGLIGKQAYQCMEPDLQQAVELLSPEEVYETMGNYLQDEHQCDLIICLSHSGYDEDYQYLSQIKKKTTTTTINDTSSSCEQNGDQFTTRGRGQGSAVDLLFGGHTHKTYKEHAILIPNHEIHNNLGGTLWHQPPAYGAAFSITKLLLHKLIPATTTSPPLRNFELLSSGLEWIDSELIADDEEMMCWFNENYGNILQHKLHREVAYCSVNWLQRNVEKMHNGKCYLGKFIASFVAQTMRTSIGLVNRGGIKTGFHKNEKISYGKAAEVLGNNNRIMSIEMKGKLLESLLKYVIPTGEYQYYGFKYYHSSSSSSSRSLSSSVEQDPRDPIAGENESGEIRLSTSKILINGEELVSHRWYQVSLVDYMWKMALLRREIYFPDLKSDWISTGGEEGKGEDLHEMYRIIEIRSHYWQDDFANYLESLQHLSEDSLIHLFEDQEGEENNDRTTVGNTKVNENG
jgi:2',3'-cyclic-nucleotide 2'-phosphodiesterase (5'-nucleotidase family)